MIINILEIQLQSSTQDLANELLQLFKHLSSEKKDKYDNHILYRVASQIWQLLQYGMGS